MTKTVVAASAIPAEGEGFHPVIEVNGNVLVFHEVFPTIDGATGYARGVAEGYSRGVLASVTLLDGWLSLKAHVETTAALKDPPDTSRGSADPLVFADDE